MFLFSLISPFHGFAAGPLRAAIECVLNGAIGVLPPGSDWLGPGPDWLGPASSASAAAVLIVSCGVFWLLNLFSLPGNWLMVAAAGLYAWFGPQEGRMAISLLTAGAAFGVAILGEVVEFLAGAVGAQRAGASRRSTLYALMGSMVGAIGGAVLGIPIPVVGSAVAAILFGGLGATAGAMYGEWTSGQTWEKSWSIGQAAFWGRTLGTIGKATLGLLILVIVGFAIAV